MWASPQRRKATRTGFKPSRVDANATQKVCLGEEKLGIGKMRRTFERRSAGGRGSLGIVPGQGPGIKGVLVVGRGNQD